MIVIGGWPTLPLFGLFKEDIEAKTALRMSSARHPMNVASIG